MNVQELLTILNEMAPFELAEDYDNSGLVAGVKNASVNSVLVCLDATLDILKYAVQNNINTVLTHHPLVFKAIKNFDGSEENELTFALKYSLNIIAFHTNADAVFMGKAFCDKAGFKYQKNIDKFGALASYEGQLSELKKCLFNIDKNLKIVGNAGNVKNLLVYTGAGGRDEEIIDNAVRCNADAIITSELKHSIALNALKRNIIIFEIGHYESEIHFVDYMVKNLNLKNIPVIPAKSSSVYSD